MENYLASDMRKLAQKKQRENVIEFERIQAAAEAGHFDTDFANIEASVVDLLKDSGYKVEVIAELHVYRVSWEGV